MGRGIRRPFVASLPDTPSTVWGFMPMTRRSFREIYLPMLFLAAVGAWLLPTRWTGRLMSVVQVIAPFQDGIATVADAVSSSPASDLEVPASAPSQRKDGDALARRNAALRHQVAALTVRVDELSREVEILTATRLWKAGEERIGARGRLIPADVIAPDLLPWRSSRLANAGALQGVRQGQAAISAEVTVKQGEAPGLRPGLAVLLGETLIGHVEQVGTETTRIKLVSDVSTEMKVLIGRFDQEGFTPLKRFFWLKGVGKARMEILDATRHDVETHRIQVGDVVLSDPTNPMLPVAMTIGTVTSIEDDRKNPLLAHLVVEPVVDFKTLRRVYVYDPTPAVKRN